MDGVAAWLAIFGAGIGAVAAWLAIFGAGIGAGGWVGAVAS